MDILSLFVVIPVLTITAILLLKDTRQVRLVSAFGMGLQLLMAASLVFLYLTARHAGNSDEMLFVKDYLWFKSLNIHYAVGVDGISVAMITLTSLVVFAGIFASWEVEFLRKEFFISLILLATGVFGFFISIDLFTMFLFYELAVIPMYLLIGIWGTGPKEYSAMKLTLMLLIGSAFVLVGFLALYHASGLRTFDLQQLAQVHFTTAFQKWVFPMIFVGFGVIGALYPLHTWSPDGHSSAPTAVSMLHAGVLMKLGGYGALRIAVYLLPQGAIAWGLFFMVLATINIIYGAFVAVMQKDLKYFTAYSSVSHCGFVLFGVATLNMMGLKGAVIQMFSHGIMTALFFALIGMVYSRTHTRMLDQMGGLAKKMPWLATTFYIAGLASLGLPGLSGFIAETHVFFGGFFGNMWANTGVMKVLTIIATMSIVVTAVYVLRGLARVFHGPITNHNFEKLTDATLPERISTGLLVAVLFAVGLLPFLFVNMIESSLLPILNRLYQSGAAAITH
jgi:NADH-quinone oxidoreductase subunit M